MFLSLFFHLDRGRGRIQECRHENNRRLEEDVDATSYWSRLRAASINIITVYSESN